MKNKYVLLLLLFFSFSFAQNRKGQFHLYPNSEAHRLYVSFTLNLEGVGDDYVSFLSAVVPEFEALSSQYGIVAKRGISISPEKLLDMERQAMQRTGKGSSVAKLNNIVELYIDNPTNERLFALATELEKINKVEYCTLISAEPVRPPGDIMPVTPLFENMQTYVGMASGVNMDYAHAMGLKGEGINIRDIEYGFNKQHEEFNDVNAAIAPGMIVSGEVDPSFPEHGTAVFGVIYADRGDYGISGMANEANEILLYTEFSQFGYNRIYAISEALENSVAGDVVIYELQMPGPTGEYCPAEYDNVVWDLTKAASDAGIIIVAAAGNGSENLDDFTYNFYNARGDSGAIIVGAGSDDEFHDRLWFSTYGERVDVQGWGQGVFTTGYGDAMAIGGDFNQNYTNFSGTSSATPIVASCVIVLQSYCHQLTGQYLTGPQMRELLKATGTPQGSFEEGNIGPLPNMEAAIIELPQFLGVNIPEEISFTVYPNPVAEKLLFNTQKLSDGSQVGIYDMLGQLVYITKLSGKKAEVDFSGFSKGMYLVKITDGIKVYTKKIVKK